MMKSGSSRPRAAPDAPTAMSSCVKRGVKRGASEAGGVRGFVTVFTGGRRGGGWGCTCGGGVWGRIADVRTEPGSTISFFTTGFGAGMGGGFFTIKPFGLAEPRVPKAMAATPADASEPARGSKPRGE